MLLFDKITYLLGIENLDMAGVLVLDGSAFLRGICLTFRRLEMKFRCIMIRKLQYIFHFLGGTSWIRNERCFRSWYLQSLPLKWCCMPLVLMACGYIKWIHMKIWTVFTWVRMELTEGNCEQVFTLMVFQKQGISWPSIYPQFLKKPLYHTGIINLFINEGRSM